MKQVLIISFASVLLLSFYSGKKPKAYLMNTNKKDSIQDTVKTFHFSTPEKNLDLLFCVQNFSYPPSLPKTLNLRVPASPFGTFNQKSIYDEKGRLIKYYYRGSLVSGIIPYGYDFIYQNDSSYTLKLLKDDDDHSVYEFIYNSKGDIQEIEHKDTTGLVDKLLIVY